MIGVALAFIAYGYAWCACAAMGQGSRGWRLALMLSALFVFYALGWLR